MLTVGELMKPEKQVRRENPPDRRSPGGELVKQSRSNIAHGLRRDTRKRAIEAGKELFGDDGQLFRPIV